MEPLGVLRRIDELGRIVIPKGIRNRLKINEGDRVELILENESNLVMRKYSTLQGVDEVAKNMLVALEKEIGIAALLCSNESFLASSSPKYQYYEGKPISSRLLTVLNERKNTGLANHAISAMGDLVNCVVFPLAKNSELIGGVILMDVASIDEFQNRIMIVFRNILLSVLKI